MSRPLKIGDRVRVYGVDGNLNPVSGVGKIVDFTDQGCPLFRDKDLKSLAQLTGPDRYDLSLPHPKQCRRLKKRQKRKLFGIYDGSGSWVDTRSSRRAAVIDYPEYKVVEFVEVPRKKKA
jgi:hypothetical protein